jgi:hypothetical protein
MEPDALVRPGDLGRYQLPKNNDSHRPHIVGDVAIRLASRNGTKTLVQRNVYGYDTTYKVHVEYQRPEDDDKRGCRTNAHNHKFLSGW